MKRLIIHILGIFLALPAVAGEGSGPTPLDDNHLLGPAQLIDNLTIFPVFAKKPSEFKEVISLTHALKDGQAEIRELGAQTGPIRQGSSSQVQAQPQVLDGAQVGTLVIENKGKKHILVLAGTVLYGGKQDRLVAQDFVVGPESTIPVGAFCIEQGRWTGNRMGQTTNGKFGAMEQLATTSVRKAGQYKGNQGMVWANVSKVNAYNMVSSSSGTLFATLDDEHVKAQRETIAKKIRAHLQASGKEKNLVGLAYAIDGKVSGVRWFLNKQIFTEFRDTIIHTAAVDSITAQARARQAEKKRVTAPAKPEDVAAFVENLRSVKVSQRNITSGLNVNEIRVTEKGFKQDCKMIDAFPDPITTDFLAE
ncbi:MAG: hypothetical protein JXR96_00625 [Deltaproteobacteria bacterium]|nr:hypothetical protein [Deltaproteobacteria bacterium]